MTTNIHARTQIRNKVAEILKGNTSVGDNVFGSRVQPISNPELPALLVYTKQENVTEQSISYPRTQQRRLSLTVEGYVKTQDKIDDEIDKIALEVEQLIAVDPSLGNLVKDTVLDTTQTVVSNNEAENPIAVIVLNYAIAYTVKENSPNIIH